MSKVLVISFASAAALIAGAIAKANGHPDSEAFGERVVDMLPPDVLHAVIGDPSDQLGDHPPQPPISNEHVEEGATQFSAEDIAAANAPAAEAAHEEPTPAPAPEPEA